MKALLQTQKVNFLEIKKEVEMGRQEIRKLKRENAAMYKEIEICSHAFLNAEQHHTEKLNERIAELMKENEALNKKLIFTEECLSNMIKKNNVNWLDPMLKLCENETKDLKDKLYRCSLQKVEISGALRTSEEDTARWRFEALKSRCIIADREYLLESNKIPFGAVSDIERKITKIDNENLKPNIAFIKSLLSYKRRSIIKFQSPQNNVQSMSVKNSPVTNEKIGEVQSSCHENEHKQPENIVIKSENELKDPDNIKSTTDVVETKPTQIMRTQKNEIMQEPVQESVLKFPNFSGVTIRKKISSSNTTLVGHENELDNGSMANKNSSGTCFRSKFRPKINPIKDSTGGILKLSTSSNINTEKKAKFDSGSTENTNMVKTSTVRKVETSDGPPKTAIKRRIFIPSKKPTNNPQ